MDRKYNFVDILKFIFAALIIMSHYASEYGNFDKRIDMIFSLYIVAVPFFFVSSSYFLFRKFNVITDAVDRKDIIFKYIKRIVIMYLCWSCIYIMFNILTWCVHGVTSKEVVGYLHQLIVYSSYNTIWFLPATAVGVAMVYILSKYLNKKQIIAVAIVFYIIGCVGQSYNFVLDKSDILKNIYDIYNYVFITTRNGVFNGFPFVAVGYVIAVNKKDVKKGIFNINLFLTFSFFVLFVAEAVVIKNVFSAINANTIIFLFPFSYFLFNWALGVELRDRKCFMTIRKLSTVMFLSQRIFLSALPLLFPGSIFEILLVNNSYVGLIYVLTVTILFSYIAIKFGKHKVVKLFI